MPRKLSLFVLLNLTLVLNGCATYEWVHPSKNKQTFYQEKLSCEEMANKLAWQAYPAPGPITINSTSIDTTVQVNENEGSKSKKISTTPVNTLPYDPYMNSRQNYRQETLFDCLGSNGWVRQKIEKL